MTNIYLHIDFCRFLTFISCCVHVLYLSICDQNSCFDGRYHLAYLALVSQPAELVTVPNCTETLHPTKVCDGVSIGFRLKLCNIQRPWLVPHNLQHVAAEHNNSYGPNTEPYSVKRKMLFEGSSLEEYTMINSATHRETLWSLSLSHSPTASPVKKVKVDALVHWITEHRPALLPYIKFNEVNIHIHDWCGPCA